jgi:enterochelin esterase-like enzyme
MSRVARLLAVAIGLVLVGVAAVAIAGTRSDAQRFSPPRTVALSCPSPSLAGGLPAKVYLPANYSRAHRYRVIYFLHGLPAGPTAYTLNDFVADAVAAGPHQAIVVAPQGARSENNDREYLDESLTENWPRAIATDLTRCTDRHYSTIANRSGRALVGLSAGGYGAYNIGLRNLATFGAVESWSGYFEATDPSGWHVLNLGSPQANAAARVPRDQTLRANLAKHPTFLGFYVGRQDARFIADNIAYSNALNAVHIPHLFRVYPGGHSGGLWSSQATAWLGYALSALAARR